MDWFNHHDFVNGFAVDPVGGKSPRMISIIFYGFYNCYNNMYKKKTFVINLLDNHNLVIHEKNDKLIVLLIYIIFGMGIALTLYLIDKKMKSVH